MTSTPSLAVQSTRNTIPPFRGNSAAACVLEQSSMASSSGVDDPNTNGGPVHVPPEDQAEINAEVVKLRSDKALVENALQRANDENERLAIRLRRSEERTRALEATVVRMTAARNESRNESRAAAAAASMSRAAAATVAAATSRGRRKSPPPRSKKPQQVWELRTLFPTRSAWSANYASTAKTRAAVQPARPSSVVSFDKVEVQEFYFDPGEAPKMYYDRRELKAFNQRRFDDAKKLRLRRGLGNGGGAAAEDQATAYADSDDDDDHHDEEVSGWGIEYFVHPQIHREMIDRKKRAREAVIKFDGSGDTLDSSGRNIEAVSREQSQWARDEARVRGSRYANCTKAGKGLKAEGAKIDGAGARLFTSAATDGKNAVDNGRKNGKEVKLPPGATCVGLHRGGGFAKAKSWSG